MKYLGKIQNEKDLVTKEYVDSTSYITDTTITSALGYTPYDSANPNGYTSNVGTVTGVKVNGSTKNPTNGVVDIGTVLTSYTETDPVFSASAASGITSSDITNWRNKQDALVSGTNIKTINSESLLGSGNITISGGGGGEIKNPTASAATLPVDAWTSIGPTLTLEKGVWIITAAANIPACGSSEGKKGVRIYDVSAGDAVTTSTNYICSNVNSFVQIQSVAIVNPTTTKTYRVQAYIGSMFTSVSATGSIMAVSITNNAAVSITQGSDNSLSIS